MDIRQIIVSTVKNDWKNVLLIPKFDYITNFLTEEEKKGVTIFPPKEMIFNSFRYFNPKDMKVVIIGQDCYINPGEAMGLSFSVPANIKIPPSLVNIYKEISSDLGIDMSKRTGDLTHWAEQGVLLLNSALTVKSGKSNSHAGLWTLYTDAIIKWMSDNLDGLVFILWGRNAKDKMEFIDENRHHCLTAVHPSPLSASKGFYGCKHFSKCNDILRKMNKPEINW